MMITQPQIRALIKERASSRDQQFSYKSGIAFKWSRPIGEAVYLVEYFLDEHVGIWSHDLANATVVEEMSSSVNDILSILRNHRKGKFGIVDMAGKRFRVPLEE